MYEFFLLMTFSLHFEIHARYYLLRSFYLSSKFISDKILKLIAIFIWGRDLNKLTFRIQHAYM